MKISVIVPYWNSEKWIGRCCDSLTSQKGDFEFIMVDDHSTDKGKDIVMKYAHDDDRFIVLVNLHQKGVSGARNTGLDYASGEWVTFLDADDELMPKAYFMFERMTWVHKKANIVQANHLRRYEKRKETVKRQFNHEGTYCITNMPMVWYMVWNKIYRRDFIGDTRFQEGMQYGEDELFILDLLAKDDWIFHTDDITMIRHYDNAGSLSKSKTKTELITQARALEEFLMRCDNTAVKTFVCNLLSEHWASKIYKGAFSQ